MWAPSWTWVIVANLLLGAHDGFASSTLVIMTTDLVGSARRGVAMGVSAGVGYLGVAASAFAAGVTAARYGLRPEPFFVGLACAIAESRIAIALRETHGHARHEASLGAGSWAELPEGVRFRETFGLVTDGTDALGVVQAGFCNNLNDAVAWGIFPLLFAGRGLGLQAIATLAAIYPAVWGSGSSRRVLVGPVGAQVGRSPPACWVQAGRCVLVVITEGFRPWLVAVVALGLGTAMVYPSCSRPSATPRIRGGAPRRWESTGSGATRPGGRRARRWAPRDAFGLSVSIATVAALTALSGGVVALRMYETGTPGVTRLRAVEQPVSVGRTPRSRHEAGRGLSYRRRGSGSCRSIPDVGSRSSRARCLVETCSATAGRVPRWWRSRRSSPRVAATMTVVARPVATPAAPPAVASPNRPRTVPG